MLSYSNFAAHWARRSGARVLPDPQVLGPRARVLVLRTVCGAQLLDEGRGPRRPALGDHVARPFQSERLEWPGTARLRALTADDHPGHGGGAGGEGPPGVRGLATNPPRAPKLSPTPPSGKGAGGNGPLCPSSRPHVPPGH